MLAYVSVHVLGGFPGRVKMPAYRSRLVPCLHFVTDELPKTVRQQATLFEAIKGGATTIQLRANGEPERDVYHIAQKLKRELTGSDVTLIVNNHVAVAEALGIGLHIGQGDLPYQVARRLLGPNAIIGLSIEDEHQAEEARHWPLAYVGVGAFHSQTKPEFRPLGLEGIARIRSRMPLPIIAIGGITHDNAREAIEAGADGIAVIGAIANADDPAAAARGLIGAITN